MNGLLTILASALLSCGGGEDAIPSTPEIVTPETPTEEKTAEYLPTPKTADITSYEGYHLVWSDEFNIDGKPSSDWTYEKGFVRNEELQWYQSYNASVKDGCLVIEGRKERIKNPNYVAGSSDWKTNREYAEYTSSCVTTQLSRQFMYGRFEVRAKIPTASGSWPAIWLLGNKWDWPQNGEIDMLEYYIKNGRPSILANNGLPYGMSLSHRSLTSPTQTRTGLRSIISGVWTGTRTLSVFILTMSCSMRLTYRKPIIRALAGTPRILSTLV